MTGNRERFSIRSLLENASDNDLVDAVYTRIIDLRGGDMDIRICTPEEQVIVLVTVTSGIIDNGGFEYLFSADFVGDPDFTLTADAFKTVGLEHAHQAFQHAFALFPRGKPPRIRNLRIRQYEAADESERSKVDNLFFSQSFLGGNGILERKLAEYIRSHASAFRHLDEPQS